MKVLRIGRDGVVEDIDVAVEEWMTDDIEWQALPIDEANDIWVDGEALSKSGLVLINIGKHQRVPLPCYIAGSDGEDMADATIPKVSVERMIA